MAEFQRPRGTRDFAPEEMRRRRDAEARMRRAAETFGFGEVQTPTFEHLELFTARSGDSVVDEMYAFQDKGERGIALRPEITAAVVRWYLNEMTKAPKPIKVFYQGNCFRYERPQAGRFREFFQFGAEIIGAPLAAADAEVVALSVACLKSVGLERFEMRIGHIGVLRSMLERMGVPKEGWPACLHALDKKDFALVHEVLDRNGIPEEKGKSLVALVKMKGGLEKLDEATRLVGELDGFAYLRELAARLHCLGLKKCEIDLGVVRGLDYYTGMVFEIDFPSLGAEKQVCGGGSYALAEVFGGEPVESTGFAIGFDRVLIAMEKEGKALKVEGPEVFVVPVGDGATKAALELATSLRNSGISTDVELMGRGLSKALKYADSIKARKAIIVGERELAQGIVTIRDMKTGAQETCPLADVARKLKD
jgi:histidyl-tRNA synthetase